LDGDDPTNTRLADDDTTTNNWSQGLDLRSSQRHEEKLPVSILPLTDTTDPRIKLEIDENKDSTLPLNLDSGYAARIAPAKAEYVAKWCEDQREFTQNRDVNYRKPKNGKLSTHDKLLKRITHPFTKYDKKKLDEVIGQITNNLTRATVTDVQHSDFVQGMHY